MAALSPAPAPGPAPTLYPVQVHGRKPTTIDLVGGISCHICSLVLGHKKEFDSHYLQHSTGTEQITYTCVVCKSASTSYPTFRDHCYTRHVIKDRFRCVNCNKSFSKQSVLKEHTDSVHSFKCNKPNCKKQFPSKKELHVHEIFHKNDANKPPYQCQTCAEQIENIQTCEHHIDQHCNFTYACPLCEENVNKDNASEHLSKHFGQTLKIEDLKVDETPEDSSINIVGGILCCVCRKLCKNRLEIVHHFAEDHPTQEVQYTCVICHKGFPKYSLYGDHCYHHISRNRFPCEVCNKNFPRLSLLVMHSEIHKVAVQEQRCRLCSLPLANAAAAQRHLAVHRRATFSCPVCDRQYAEKYLLMKHVPQHFEAVYHLCKVCGKAFTAKHRLIEHVKIHSSVKDHKCKYCGKEFLKPYQLSQHINLHTGARPYKCFECPKAFASLPNFQKHVRRMHNIDPKTIDKTLLPDSKVNDEPMPLEAEILQSGQKNLEEKRSIFDFADSIVHKNLHTGARPYKCFACPKAFAYLPNFQKHVRRMHDIDPKTIDKTLLPDLKTDSKVNDEPMPLEAEILQSGQKNLEEKRSIFDLVDEIVVPENIDSIVVQQEANTFEILDTSCDLAELTPILPEEIDKIVSEMLSERPALIPREYGPDFLPDEAPLPHVAPQLVAAPDLAPSAPTAAPAPAPWEHPLITKVCGSYYGDFDFDFFNTDIF